MKAIVAVIYGNRDYDDALLELADIAVEDGFEVVAAGAFIAQHCIFPKVANGRPDASDMAVATDFIKRAKESGKLDISTIKGIVLIRSPVRCRRDRRQMKASAAPVEYVPASVRPPSTL